MDGNSFPLLAGLAAALLHVLAGPDHLAAVAPFAVERAKKAWKVGLLWGIGHLAGMLVIGVLFLLFKDYIPVEEISGYSEKFVGVLLILLGIWILYKVYGTKKTHSHVHTHTHTESLLHKHTHNNEKKHNHTHVGVKQGNLSTFFIGLVHGLAGVAHFLVFAPVIGFPKAQAAQYIVGFAIGTLLAMTVFAVIMGKIAEFSKRGDEENERIFTGIRVACAVFAIVFGIYWMVAN